MVAPSFETYKVLTDPFLKNGKLYITVQHPRTHNKRDVRWYSPEEFKKRYPNHSIEDPGFTGLKQARGFTNGPIKVVANLSKDLSTLDEYLHRSPARFAVDTGWYFLSTDEIPTPPIPLKIVELTWDEFRDKDDYHKKTATELFRIIQNKPQEIYS